MEAFSTRSFWIPVALATLVAACFGIVLARRGRTLEAMLAEQARLDARLAELEQENEALRIERAALLSSPEAIERVAREDYGFTAPEERVEEYEPAAGAQGQTPTEGHAQGPGRSLGGLLAWRNLPLLLPASVFLVTALVFGLLNALAGRAGAEPD